MGQLETARDLIDRVLERYPNHPAALEARRQIADRATPTPDLPVGHPVLPPGHPTVAP